ncbi:flagellar protein FlaG [Bacillus tianshenii]|nr:flagellar protein FlaG [Bacillus tianshenii]
MVTQASNNTYLLANYPNTKQITNIGSNNAVSQAKSTKVENIIYLGNQEKQQSNELSVSKEVLRKQVEELNKLAEASYTTLSFKLHEKTDRYYVQVVDQGTKEVVREVPPEKFLDMMGRMWEFMGLIIDEKI